MGDAEQSTVLLGEGVHWDGRYLIVRTDAILPPFCVRTGIPLEACDMHTRTFTWSSDSGVPMPDVVFVLAYFLNLRKCRITFGMSPSVRNWYRALGVGKLLCFPFLMALGWVYASLPGPLVLVSLGVILVFLVCALNAGNSPLTVIDHREGFFWVSGSSRKYVEAAIQ